MRRAKSKVCLLLTVLTFIFSFQTKCYAFGGSCRDLFLEIQNSNRLRPIVSVLWSDSALKNSLFQRPDAQRIATRMKESFDHPGSRSFSGEPQDEITINPPYSTEGLKVLGGFRVQHDGTLNINFRSIRIIHRRRHPQGEDWEMPYGDRPGKANLYLMDLVAGTIAAARQYASSHPEIRHVLFRAQQLESPSLRDLLISSGFAPAPAEENRAPDLWLQLDI